jgi:hypothetical protein
MNILSLLYIELRIGLPIPSIGVGKSLNFQTKYYSFNTNPRNALNYAASTFASPSIPKNQRMPYIALNPEDT